jgi:hypothetical protein
MWTGSDGSGERWMGVEKESVVLTVIYVCFKSRV